MKNLATLRNSYNSIHQARHQWALAIIENLKEMGKEIKVLGDYYDPEDGWPEGLHIVIMDDDNYPQDIVIDSVKYEEKEYSNIAVHLCYWDPNKCDQWWSISDFSSDDADTILLAIQWPESVKQGEAEQEQEAIMVLYFVDEDNTKDMLLAARKSDLEAGNKRQEIEQCLRETFNIDERKEWEDCDPEGMDRGLQKAADKLAKGEQAYFDTYDFAWEKVSII